MVPSLLLLCFNFIVVLIPSLLAFYMNDQRNKLQDLLKKRKKKLKKNLFPSTCHHHKDCRHRLFYNTIANATRCNPFHLGTIHFILLCSILSDIHCRFVVVRSDWHNWFHFGIVCSVLFNIGCHFFRCLLFYLTSVAIPFEFCCHFI